MRPLSCYDVDGRERVSKYACFGRTATAPVSVSAAGGIGKIEIGNVIVREDEPQDHIVYSNQNFNRLICLSVIHVIHVAEVSRI